MSYRLSRPQCVLRLAVALLRDVHADVLVVARESVALFDRHRIVGVSIVSRFDCACGLIDPDYRARGKIKVLRLDAQRSRTRFVGGDIDFELAEIGGGSVSASGAIKRDLKATYGQFNRRRHSRTGVVLTPSGVLLGVRM